MQYSILHQQSGHIDALWAKHMAYGHGLEACIIGISLITLRVFHEKDLACGVTIPNTSVHK